MQDTAIVVSGILLHTKELFKNHPECRHGGFDGAKKKNDATTRLPHINRFILGDFGQAAKQPSPVGSVSGKPSVTSHQRCQKQVSATEVLFLQCLGGSGDTADGSEIRLINTVEVDSLSDLSDYLQVCCQNPR